MSRIGRSLLMALLLLGGGGRTQPIELPPRQETRPRRIWRKQSQPTGAGWGWRQSPPLVMGGTPEQRAARRTLELRRCHERRDRREAQGRPRVARLAGRAR